MIQASLKVHGMPTILFGLTRENTERLLAGHPIVIDLTPLVEAMGEPPGRVLICAGETEDALTGELLGAVDSDMRVGQPRRPLDDQAP